MEQKEEFQNKIEITTEVTQTQELPSYNFILDLEKAKKKFEANEMKDFHGLENVMLQLLKIQSKKKEGSILFVGLQMAIEKFTLFIQKKQRDFNFYKDLLPKIVEWCFDSPPSTITLLSAGLEATVSLSPAQIRSILANAFFFNVTEVDVTKYKTKVPIYGNIYFSQLYANTNSVSIQRIICQLNYFYRMLDSSLLKADNIQFIRKVLDPKNAPDWHSIDIPISPDIVQIITKRMEDSPAKFFVDFANQDLHIGWFLFKFFILNT